MSILYWSPNSPYVKKVMLALRETGLEDTLTTKRGGEVVDSVSQVSRELKYPSTSTSDRSDTEEH